MLARRFSSHSAAVGDGSAICPLRRTSRAARGYPPDEFRRAGTADVVVGIVSSLLASAASMAASKFAQPWSGYRRA